MADNDGGSGLRHLMPGVFSGIASALTALAGILGLLHEGGYFANRAPAATVVASARAPGQLAVSAADSAVSRGPFSLATCSTVPSAPPERRGRLERRCWRRMPCD